VMLAKGRVMMTGTPDEFKNTRNTYVKDFIEGRAPVGEDVASLLSSS
jgi:phospholipid/cholesterol/gamma-HCH transport system ATP-binding protein